MMTTQIKLIVAGGILAALLGGAYLVEHTWAAAITEARAAGERSGREAALRETSERDNAKLAAALKRVQELEAQVRKREQDATDEILAAQAIHKKEMNHANAENARLAAAVRAGTLRLRDAQGRAGPGCTGGGDGAKTETAAATAGGDARPGCELSGRTSENLLGLAKRADDVRANLRLCQTTVRTYLKACAQ